MVVRNIGYRMNTAEELVGHLKIRVRTAEKAKDGAKNKRERK